LTEVFNTAAAQATCPGLLGVDIVEISCTQMEPWPR
jgi:hypothetical protein